MSKVFYHADVYGWLKEGQSLTLDINSNSKFGDAYHKYIKENNGHYYDPNGERELLLEAIRIGSPTFKNKPSRLKSIFCCATIEETIKFLRVYTNAPKDKVINIFEIVVEDASKCTTHDMSWLDNEHCSFDEKMDRYGKYWDGEKSDLPYPTILEVIVPLPATVGKLACSGAFRFVREEFNI